MVWRIAVIGVVALALLLSGCQLGFDRGDRRPAWSPDGTKIAFSSGSGEIYVMNADGSDQTNLTNNPARDDYSTWSPDGTKIAFSSSRDGRIDLDIYIMDTDGSSQTKLTNSPLQNDEKAAWSPDGTRIAFFSTASIGRGVFLGSRDIYVMNADGSSQTNLTKDVGMASSLTWSPDGTKIFFTRGDSIYVMNADGSNRTRVTNYDKSIWRAAWSPDLTKIAFRGLRDEIYVMNADGSDQINLTNSLAREGYVAWSPDGTKIAFASASTVDFHIYIMDADGTNRTRLTGGAGVVFFFLVLGLVAGGIIVSIWWLIRRYRIVGRKAVVVASVRCESCGQDNPPEARFCANCGITLVTTVKPPSPVSGPSPPREPAAVAAEPTGFRSKYKWLTIASAIITIVLVGVVVWQVQQTPSPVKELLPPPVPPETVITFPDEDLEIAIRDALGKPPGEEITAAELAELTQLDADGSGIADLTGIEYCVNLYELGLFNNQISDLSPLDNLTNLIDLRLGYNQISDISPLVANSGLGAKDLVWLENNNLDLSEGSQDLENIRVLRNRGVTVDYNPPLAPPLGPPETVITFPDENLEAAIRKALRKPAGEAITAAELAELTTMRFGRRQSIADLTGIEYCTNLTHLNLWDKQISDLSPLTSLANMIDLNLGNNQISDISPLASLTNLAFLNLGNNQISDITPLASLTILTKLYLANNQISDLLPLTSLTNLTYLYLANNQISDLSPLSSLTNLTLLFLYHNRVSDLSPLSSLTNLAGLDLHHNEVSDLSPLVANSGLGAEDRVYIWYNNLDLSKGSEDLENIKQLEARGVEVHYQDP